jgi:hypothetical protein
VPPGLIPNVDNTAPAPPAPRDKSLLNKFFGAI